MSTDHALSDTAAFTEEDIRPAELMDRQRVAVLVDLGRLLSRRDEFVEVDCPACASPDGALSLSKNGLQYETCAQCATMYMNPRPSSDVLDWFYQGSVNYAYWNDVIFPASEDSRRVRIFQPRVDKVLELCRTYGVETGALMDVGAGYGTFCAEVVSRGVFDRVVAVEPTPSLAETCRRRGIETVERPIEQVEIGEGGGFDVIANFEVIEHLFNPRAFVAEMARLLRPGGLLVLTCPNGQGFDVATLGAASLTVDHEHLNYFNPDSIGRLLSESGLTVLGRFTPGRLDADLVRTQALAGDLDLSGQPFLRRVIIDEWDRLGGPFQAFLVEHGLSSNLWAVAQKPAG